ncbi:hypothetical protein [Aquisphaera insulae]|uniref:hypothetical protein n=1 Tax=Aquisphaera insulae TaxID=2712864 RepID=UPI0013EBF813|nr:hypothetical protein [Aquisphaera insulae]
MHAGWSKPTFKVYPEAQRSLQLLALEEANRYKWYESEKAGYDRGEWAIRQWIKNYWPMFVRCRWLEHLEGDIFWQELVETNFGILKSALRESPLLQPILSRLMSMDENLDIIHWAHHVADLSQEQVEEIVIILSALNVNSCRLKCEFEPSQQARIAVA